MAKVEKMLLTPSEVGEALGIPRTRVYELLGAGLPQVRFGRSRRVPVDALRQWIAERSGEAEAATR